MSDVDRDFEPLTTGEQIRRRLVRGEGRREIAADLGLSLVTVHSEVAALARAASGAAGNVGSRLYVIYECLADVQRRAVEALDYARDPAPLLAVLVDVLRLRAALLASERPPGRKASKPKRD